MMNLLAIHKSSSQGATSSLIWSRVSSHLVNISQIFTFLWLFSGSPTTPEEKLSLAALTMMRVNRSPFHRSAPNLKFCNIYQLSCMCERKCPNHWHKLKPASSLVLSLHNMKLSPCANRGGHCRGKCVDVLTLLLDTDPKCCIFFLWQDLKCTRCRCLILILHTHFCMPLHLFPLFC